MLGLLWHKEKLRGIKLIKCFNYLGHSGIRGNLRGLRGNFSGNYFHAKHANTMNQAFSVLCNIPAVAFSILSCQHVHQNQNSIYQLPTKWDTHSYCRIVAKHLSSIACMHTQKHFSATERHAASLGNFLQQFQTFKRRFHARLQARASEKHHSISLGN